MQGSRIFEYNDDPRGVFFRKTVKPRPIRMPYVNSLSRHIIEAETAETDYKPRSPEDTL